MIWSFCGNAVSVRLGEKSWGASEASANKNNSLQQVRSAVRASSSNSAHQTVYYFSF